VQLLALAGFLAAFALARRGGAPPQAANIPMRLDPLAALAHALAGREFAAGMLLSLLVVALTLGLGRAWCGWLCPLGTILDLASPGRKRVRPLSRAEPMRKIKTVIAAMLLSGALLGSLSLMILDPLTLLTRSLACPRMVANRPSGARDQALPRSCAGWRASMRPAPDCCTDRPQIAGAGPVHRRSRHKLIAERFWCRYRAAGHALLFPAGDRPTGDRGLQRLQRLCARLPNRDHPRRECHEKRSGGVHDVPRMPLRVPAPRH
jgi:hypothetical protein